MTGMFAAFGEGGVFGLRAAVDDINKQGGVYVEEYGTKIPIKLIVVDTESDPIKSGTLAEDLILRDDVHFLVTHNKPPPLHAPIAMVAERYKVPYVAGVAVLEPWLGLQEAIEPRWQYTWGTGFAIATPAPPGDFRAKPGYTSLEEGFYMLDKFADQTNMVAGVFATDEPDGRAWYQFLPNVLEEKGLEVVGLEKELGLFLMGTTDFTSIIQEWKENDVEILFGNCPSPDFATLWRQAKTMNFQPKMVIAVRAALYYTDIASWGGDLPLGIGSDMYWEPRMKGVSGIGDTTPQSLYEGWVEETGQPLNFGIAWGYMQMQILIDAIERAGSLDGATVNKALGETDLMTMNHRVLFDKETQFSRVPVFFGQWFKTDEPWVWDLRIVLSEHDFLPAAADPIFPIPYD